MSVKMFCDFCEEEDSDCREFRYAWHDNPPNALISMHVCMDCIWRLDNPFETIKAGMQKMGDLQ